MTQPAVNPIPTCVILLFLPIVAVEIYVFGAEARLWGAFDARIAIIREFAFAPDGFRRTFAAGAWVPEVYWRMFTAPFVHWSLMQAMFASVFVLALGKFVAEAMGNIAVALVFFVSNIIGLLAFTALTSSTFPLAGAYPAAYGLIGAFTFVLFSRAQGMVRQQVAAFRLVGILMLINIGMSLVGGGPPVWLAELVGAMTGFIAAACLRAGGMKYILAKIRGN
ncbi:MAG: rhomboid family intramembrane serine protease [Planktomarina sp.]